MSKEPTDEQKKEFWEGCGLEYRKTEIEVGGHGGEEPAYYLGWFAPDGKFLSFRSVLILDLNNLSRYALTRLRNPFITMHLREDGTCIVNVYHAKEEGKPYSIGTGEATKLEDALFWAIREVIHKEEKDGS